MSKETTIESIVNENISMKIFLSNMEQKHEHEKEAHHDGNNVRNYFCECQRKCY